MIISLRKRHRFIWFFLVVLLPVFFILAILERPREEGEQAHPVAQKNFEAEFVKKGNNDDLEATLYLSAMKNSAILKIALEHAQSNPSTAVYISQEEDFRLGQASFAGGLYSRGVHEYMLDTVVCEYQSFFLHLYDPIKNTTITSLSLK